MAPATRLVLLIGWLGYALMPWYLVEGMSLTSWAWLAEYPFGKAGSYAIQSALAGWIEHIDGSHSSIMGLPLFETAQLLRRAGVPTTL